MGRSRCGARSTCATASRSSRSRWISTASISRPPTSWSRWPSASIGATKSSMPTARRARKSSSSTRGWRWSVRCRCCRPVLTPSGGARPCPRRGVASGSATGSRCRCTGWRRSPPGRRSRARPSSSRRRRRCSCASPSASPSRRTAGSTSASADRVSVNLRHNVAALGADYALFVVGLAFASQSTILPAFAAYLGAPNVVIGAIPAVMTLGWFMPSLFAAGVVVREPASTSSAPAVPLREYLARIRALLGRDPNLAWFLAARAFGVVGTVGNGFYTVYALRAWDAPVAQVGVFTTLLFVGQMVGNAALGWLADRRGHRLVIILGFGATLTGNVVAIAAPTLGAFGMVFVMMGIQIAAMNVSNLNVMLEFAPKTSAQPTYVGLGTTLQAPFAFVAPLAAGLLADALGFIAVFAVAAVAVSVALALLIARVRDPRAMMATPAA